MLRILQKPTRSVANDGSEAQFFEPAASQWLTHERLGVCLFDRLSQVAFAKFPSLTWKDVPARVLQEAGGRLDYLAERVVV